MEKLQLVVPQFYRITRSFSKKVQVKQYEPIDLFASHNFEIPEEEATPEKIAEVSSLLYKRCMEEIERDTANYIREAQLANGEVVLPTSNDILGIASIVKELSDGGKTKVEAISAKIAKVKDTLNESQLAFLRQLVIHIKNG